MNIAIVTCKLIYQDFLSEGMSSDYLGTVVREINEIFENYYVATRVAT